MPDQTKIQFLPAEMEMVSSPDVILTKNAILEKIRLFLDELQRKQATIINQYFSFFPEEVLKISPKISRGENYKGLPWLVLDYPRHFEHHNIFAIRTMFWWGNFFSITLHVSGRYKERVKTKMMENLATLANNEVFIYNGEKEWEHDFDPGCYKKLTGVQKEELESIITKNTFLKMGVRIPITSLVNLENKLCRDYELITKYCI